MMSTLGYRKWLISLIVLLFGNMTYAGQTFQHQGTPPQLIELYTSEGCSSCPPADRYLSSLVDSPELWKRIIPMAFHVDYWDYIGWKDRFAHPSYKQRQYDYRALGKLKSVYTPGWVVDGQEWRGFFQGRSLPSPPQRSGGKLTAELNQGNLNIHFDKDGTGSKLTAHVALIGFDQQSIVTAGENSGKTLSHQFAVLNKQQKTSTSSQWQFEIPESDISSKTALAIWITKPEMQILQATAGWIE